MPGTLETAPSPTVHEAIDTRKSVRAFLPDPVDPALLREILTTASRAASGGNLQPWRIHVLAGEARDALVAAVAEQQKETPFGDGPEYPIYPHDLTEPYLTRVPQQNGEPNALVQWRQLAQDLQMLAETGRPTADFLERLAKIEAQERAAHKLQQDYGISFEELKVCDCTRTGLVARVCTRLRVPGSVVPLWR